MYNYCIVVIYFIHSGGMVMNEFVITKKIAKHGSQAVIVVPKVLQEELKPQTLVKLSIEILKRPDE